MSTEFWYNDAGTFRKMKEVWYNDAGTWRKAKEVWYNDAGTWRKVFTGAVPALTNKTVSASQITITPAAAEANAHLIFASNGVLYVYSKDDTTSNTAITGEWLTSSPAAGDGSGFEIFATLNTGSLDFGTTGSWLALSSDQTWGIGAFRGSIGVSSQTANVTFTIRATGTTTNLVSASIALSVTAEVDSGA